MRSVCIIALSGVLSVWGGSPPSSATPRHPGASPPAVAPLGKPGCRPNCRGRICGSDGCGGTCGRCGKGRHCAKNRCVKGSSDPCVRVHGRWTGAMLISPLHRLDGRVWGRKKTCRARFRVTFSTGWVLQDFTVTFSKGQVVFRGRRIVGRGSTGYYALDTFTGRFNAGRTRFRGKLRDTANVTGPVVLRRR